MIDLLISIDPGSSGAICTYKNKRITAVNMPEDAVKLKDYLIQVMEGSKTFFCFIERVSMFHSDMNDKGKVFQIQKMMANYERLKTVLKLLEIPYYEVGSREWQKIFLGERKFESKSDRKRALKHLAQKKVKQIKVTMKNCDALLILIYANFELSRQPKKYLK